MTGSSRPQGVLDGAVEIAELRVAIGVIVPLLGLAIAWQAVAIFPQELGDFGVADRMVLGSQFSPPPDPRRLRFCCWSPQASYAFAQGLL